MHFLIGILAACSWLSFPLAIDYSNSLEAEADAKEVISEQVLHQGELAIDFDIDPHGKRAKGSPDDPDYALYGSHSVYVNLDGVSLDDYNRLAIDITPECNGMRVLNMTMSFQNGSAPDGVHNQPPADHLIHLRNGITKRYYLEIADLQRDNMRGLRFNVSLNGMDLPFSSDKTIRIDRIAAQKIAEPEQVTGWEPQHSNIIYSMSGYDAKGQKTAIVGADKVADNSRFILRDVNNGREVYSGKVNRKTTTIGSFGHIDFSDFNQPGMYVLEAGDLKTDTFPIDNSSIWESASGKLLNYIYSQRCGYPVFGIHSHCHIDLFSEHNGERRSYAGGWHDAGDLSQQTLQTADVVYALLELYQRKKDTDPALANRLREEALWGLEFVMRTRYGDGFHASSMGLLIWQDGIFGSHDDITSVRVQDIAYDNYLYAAYEAYAAKVLTDDAALCAYLRQIAAEDYDFACRKFEKSGYGGWISPYEHTYCTGESQHNATACWAASMLYDLTGDDRYKHEAVDYGRYVLDSRCSEPVGTYGLKGFFYRNPQKRSVVHYIHQSREQLFMEALAALCRTQPTHPDYNEWLTAIADYGDYIKALMKFSAPYGMIPAGIYRDDEADDSEAFFAVHLFPPADARERFDNQRQNGVDVGGGYFVKRFPVWFNIFNGNLAVHTSMGKAAALCARTLGDEELMDIAREQLYWNVGKNPFAQSLIYGEGHRYPELNSFSSGLITGSVPVGIRTLGDSDEPYWPQFNSACYKEVWVTSAGKLLSLIAAVDSDFYDEDNQKLYSKL